MTEELALLQANRERRQAIEQLDRGDVRAAMASLEEIDYRLSGLTQSTGMQRERQLLAEKKELMQQDRNLSRKRLRNESLRSSLNVWEGSDDDD